MPESITIEMPWPPSDNRLKTLTTFGKRPSSILSKEGREYYARVSSMLVLRRIPRMAGRLRVDVVLHPPDRRHIDASNRLKAIMDSLKRRHLGRAKKGVARRYDPKQTGWLFADDDSQAVQGSWELRGIIPNGKAIVTLTKLPGEIQPELFFEEYP